MTLKEVRLSKKISQTTASKFLGVPLRSYKRYEKEAKYENGIKYNFLLNELSKYNCKDVEERKFIRKPNIVIAGIGYVGLSSAILLSKKAKVTLLDINIDKIKNINNKKSPIRTKEFISAIKNAELKATDDIFVYRNADIVLIATPTDLDETTNKLDMFNVESVIRIVREINKKCLIVIKSTVSIGFTKKIIDLYDSNIIFWPEFLREKSAVSDSFNPSRIIFGVKKKNKKINRFQLIVESSVKNDQKVIYMSESDAEAVKLFSNTYLAARIAFFNELDSYAYLHNLNSKNIINGLGKDPRIGNDYNNPSIMFSGYCLPKDSKEIETTLSMESNNQLINSISASNNSRLIQIKNMVIDKAISLSKKEKKNIVIGFYNLDTQATQKGYRDSSALTLLNVLKKDNVKTLVYDKIYKNSVENLDDFCNNVDIIVANSYSSILKKYKNKIFTRNVK